MDTSLDDRLPAPEIDPFSRALSGLIPGIALIAVTAVAVTPFRSHLNSGTIAIVLLIPVLIATIGGVWVALAVAVLGAATLNYFFTPPLRSLRIESADGVVAFVAYLMVAALVAFTLSRRRDAERLAGTRERDARFVLTAASELAEAAQIDEAVEHVLGGLLIAAHLRGASVRSGDVDETAGQITAGVGLGVLTVDPGSEPLAGDRRRLVEELAAVFALAVGPQPTTAQL